LEAIQIHITNKPRTTFIGATAYCSFLDWFTLDIFVIFFYGGYSRKENVVINNNVPINYYFACIKNSGKTEQQTKMLSTSPYTEFTDKTLHTENSQ